MLCAATDVIGAVRMGLLPTILQCAARAAHPHDRNLSRAVQVGLASISAAVRRAGGSLAQA